MNVNYYLKDSKKDKTAIIAVVRFKGRRYKLAPGAVVEKNYWLPAEKRASEKQPYKTDGQIINIILDRFEARVKSFFEPYILTGTPPAQDEVNKAIKAEKSAQDEAAAPEQVFYTDQFKTYYENADYKLETWKKYNTTFNWLLKYETQFKTRLTFDAINLDFYENFKFWILSKKYTPKKDADPQNYSVNYFGSLVKCIKHVMAETGPSGLKLHNNQEYKNKKFKTPHETADTVYLSAAELQKIHAFKPDFTNVEPVCSDPRASQRERKINALNLAKNKFLIGCYTALRVSDFNRLDEVNVNTGFISIRPEKGTRKNDNVIIPIHPVIREILATGFKLNTPVTEQKINKHIKEVCKLVGINDQVLTARTEGGRVVERTAPKYELITNHTARRTGATLMYLAGIPTVSIMKLTGHKTERSFLKYIRITQEENAILLASHPFFK